MHYLVGRWLSMRLFKFITLTMFGSCAGGQSICFLMSKVKWVKNNGVAHCCWFVTLQGIRLYLFFILDGFEIEEGGSCSVNKFSGAQINFSQRIRTCA